MESVQESPSALAKGVLEILAFLRRRTQRPRRPSGAFTILDQDLNIHRCLHWTPVQRPLGVLRRASAVRW